MIVGYHIVIGMYGFWLPNDPRGSWSDCVGSLELFHKGGPATRTETRRSVAAAPHDREKRSQTKHALRYPPVKLSGMQARAVARGFSHYFSRADCSAWACAILPDHVHLVVSRGRLHAEKIALGAKSCATRALKKEGIHPQQAFADLAGRVPKCFARNAWKVFLHEEDVARAVRYVEENPVKAGLAKQRWSFVVPGPYGAQRSAPQTPPRC